MSNINTIENDYTFFVLWKGNRSDGIMFRWRVPRVTEFWSGIDEGMYACHIW